MREFRVILETAHRWVDVRIIAKTEPEAGKALRRYLQAEGLQKGYAITGMWGYSDAPGGVAVARTVDSGRRV
jgi:hypothetical protein